MRLGEGERAREINPDKNARETWAAFSRGKLVLVMTTHLPAARDVPRVLPAQGHDFSFLPWNFAIFANFRNGALLHCEISGVSFRKLEAISRSQVKIRHLSIAERDLPTCHSSAPICFKDKHSTNTFLRGRELVSFRNAREQKYLLRGLCTCKHSYTHVYIQTPHESYTLCSDDRPLPMDHPVYKTWLH